jgi:diguanylate cyclase (GGDEF)-like protein
MGRGSGYARTVERPQDPIPARRADDERAARFARRFGEALRVGQANLAERVSEEALESGFDPTAVQCRVIGPAMEWIGELWARGAITAADEHLATAISHGVLARLFPLLLRAPARSRERVMLAAAEGEHHVLGLRMVADVLEGAGFDVLYLGPDVPLDALLDACRRHRPVVLCLGVTMPLNVPTLLTELVAVSDMEQPPLLMVGGRALTQAIEARLTVPVVVSGDQVVAAVERLIAEGRQGPPLEQSLLERIPRGPAAAAAGVGEIGTIPDHFSATALASAETARGASRRAHAMEQLAFRDPLTGTWNRRAFDDRFVDLSGRSGDLVLLMIDVDRFKTINDTWGHGVGDATLVAVARTILKNVRPGDFVARFGGDEFIVLLPTAGVPEATVVAERVRTAVVDELRDPPVTVSIGLASFSGDQRLTGLTVDRALYEAKSGGRNRVAVGAA